MVYCVHHRSIFRADATYRSPLLAPAPQHSLCACVLRCWGRSACRRPEADGNQERKGLLKLAQAETPGDGPPFVPERASKIIKKEGDITCRSDTGRRSCRSALMQRVIGS